MFRELELHLDEVARSDPVLPYLFGIGIEEPRTNPCDPEAATLIEPQGIHAGVGRAHRQPLVASVARKIDDRIDGPCAEAPAAIGLCDGEVLDLEGSIVRDEQRHSDLYPVVGEREKLTLIYVGANHVLRLVGLEQQLKERLSSAFHLP